MASNITVSALAVTNGFGQNFAAWAVTDPNINGHRYRQLKTVELWAHSSNDRGADDGSGIPANAVKVAQGINEAVHVLASGAARWYWARAVDNEGSYGAWHPSSATAGVAAAATASIGTNGYVKLPSGLIIQWGQNNSAIPFATVTFPIQFPNEMLSLSLTPLTDATTRLLSATKTGEDATGFSFTLGYADSGSSTITTIAGLPVLWIAIGY